jgi:glutamate--cysteine ligase
LIRGWSAGERQRLRDEVPRLGFETRVGGRSAREAARDMLAVARGGLQRRARRNAGGRDESFYLDPLDAIVESGVEPARAWLARFAGPWGGSVHPIFAEARIWS